MRRQADTSAHCVHASVRFGKKITSAHCVHASVRVGNRCLRNKRPSNMSIEEGLGPPHHQDQCWHKAQGRFRALRNKRPSLRRSARFAKSATLNSGVRGLRYSAIDLTGWAFISQTPGKDPRRHALFCSTKRACGLLGSVSRRAVSCTRKYKRIDADARKQVFP